MYFLYLIESLKDGKYYIGQTNNLDERLKYHNRAKRKYTKNRGPWILRGYRSFSTRAEAMSEEKRLKQFKNRSVVEEYFKTEA